MGDEANTLANLEFFFWPSSPDTLLIQALGIAVHRYCPSAEELWISEY